MASRGFGVQGPRFRVLGLLRASLVFLRLFFFVVPATSPRLMFVGLLGCSGSRCRWMALGIVSIRAER